MPQPDPATHARPFSDFLREHGAGRTHDELSEALHDLIRKVKDTGKKGSVSLAIVVEPVKKDERLVIVSDKITLRMPEHDRPSAMWFTDRNGNLTRSDPDQLVFEALREVPPPNVDLATGEVLDGTN